MLARVEVVDDKLDNLVSFKYERMGILSVDSGFRGKLPSCQGGVKSGNLGGRVGDVIKKGAMQIGQQGPQAAFVTHDTHTSLPRLQGCP